MFEGAHYRLDEANPQPKSLGQSPLPLIVGGRGGPRSVALAARWAAAHMGSASRGAAENPAMLSRIV